MNEDKDYRGIDFFGFIAVFLIIGLHTLPLLFYSEIGDFILTRIISRLAFPFFFMVAGFYLIPRYSKNNDKLKGFIKKICIIYALSTLIYIPLNIYIGYFKMDNFLSNLIKDILFNGSFYHLWFFPALIIGATIAWFAVKKLGVNKALLVTAILYIFGLANMVMYVSIFGDSDYSRNRIFLVPIFFVLGSIIGGKRKRLSLKNSLIGFFVSFALMSAEAILMQKYELLHKDSMYIFLIPCMYFLFNSLTYWKGKRTRILTTSTLLIYIIHPMVISLLKKPDLRGRILHFLLVGFLTTAFAFAVSLLLIKRSKKNKYGGNERAWIEVDLNNLENNVNVLNEAMPKGCNIMAVLKAEAYGHGAYELASYLSQLGVKTFALATIDEGIELRSYGIEGEILVLGFTNPKRAKELHKYKLIQSLISYDYACLLNEQGYKVKGHMKIDSGMHRLGIDVMDVDSMVKVFAMKNLDVCGIFTHLCVSDSLAKEDIDFTKGQIKSFYASLESLKERGIKIPKIHTQSSYGLLNYPELECDYVRIGVSLFGVLSSMHDDIRVELDLKPVLALKSQIAILRDIKKGDSVGYGRAFVAKEDSKVAILPIGYADGVPRSLSYGKGEVLINGQRAPIAGRICMDQLAVDVTGLDKVAVGDIVTLVGKDGKDELSAEEVSDNFDSITNELLSRMGGRLRIVTKK